MASRLPIPRSPTAQVPGMRPGAIRWNVLVGLFYLVLLLVAVDLVVAVIG